METGDLDDPQAVLAGGDDVTGGIGDGDAKRTVWPWIAVARALAISDVPGVVANRWVMLISVPTVASPGSRYG